MPRTEIVPRSGFRNPSTHSIVVVLPAPLGPISPKISPSFTSNDTSSTATVEPYVFRKPETRMTGAAATPALLRVVSLERTDPDVAEAHRVAVILQADRSLR